MEFWVLTILLALVGYFHSKKYENRERKELESERQAIKDYDVQSAKVISIFIIIFILMIIIR